MRNSIFLILFILPFYLFGQGFEIKNITNEQINNIVNRTKYSSQYLEYTKKALKVEDFLPKGFHKTGKVDYTVFVQKALNSGSVILMPDFPILINDVGLTLNNNQILLFQKNSRILLNPSNKENYTMLAINNKSNIKIFYPNLIGDRKKHVGKSGQWGFGIGIKGGKNIEILGGQFQDMWGDGIYIGPFQKNPSQYVVIKNVYINECRRNGISITSGRDISIYNAIISNTNGQSPQSGIDIEPNNMSDIIDNINIENVNTINNNWSGILIVLEKFKGNSPKKVNINIDNHHDVGSVAGIALHGYKGNKSYKNLSGDINIKRSTYKGNKRQKIYFYRSFYDKLNINSENELFSTEFKKRNVK